MKVIPGARKTSVEPLADGNLKVRVTAPPEDGRANIAVVEALAEYYNLPKRAVTMVRGHASRTKVLDIHTNT